MPIRFFKKKRPRRKYISPCILGIVCLKVKIFCVTLASHQMIRRSSSQGSMSQTIQVHVNPCGYKSWTEQRVKSSLSHGGWLSQPRFRHRFPNNGLFLCNVLITSELPWSQRDVLCSSTWAWFELSAARNLFQIHIESRSEILAAPEWKD